MSLFLSRQLEDERQERQNLLAQLVSERARTEACQQQVLFLERELDEKELELQATNDARDRQEEMNHQQLQQVENQLNEARLKIAATGCRDVVPARSRVQRRPLQATARLGTDSQCIGWDEDYNDAYIPLVTDSLLVSESRSQILRSQLIEKEHQLDKKDEHIAELLEILRRRGIFVEDDRASSCPSEKTVSTADSLTRCPFTRQR